jgi:hypothetical protein
VNDRSIAADEGAAMHDVSVVMKCRQEVTVNEEI